MKKFLNNFEILSSKEERELAPDELEEYIINLREYLKNRKLQTLTPGGRFLGPRLKK